jgi:uroporphyrinogen III methyltransferase/synthase
MNLDRSGAGGDAGHERGTVYLVGAGPGDPKLITLAGKEALERADVVVSDRLAHPKLLDFAPASALRVDAGKASSRHTMTQDEINAVLAEHALAGKTVVRLKGGDPFVFGRGGEEAEYLRARGIDFAVVPGITSAIAAPAYAGIPVTHRDDASSFAVITGHERAEAGESAGRSPGAAEQRRRWDRIAHAADTLVFLMGVEAIGEIARNLIDNGRAPETPVAMVRWGTWAGRQRTLVGVLADIAQKVADSGFTAPAVTVIGDVVRRREELRWWDNRPLAGKRIVVTRAREQASGLVDALDALGAETVEFPTIKIVPPSAGFADLDAEIARVSRFEWLVLSSTNAVDALFDRLAAAGLDARALATSKIAAVGAATADRLWDRGIRADFAPSKATGEDLAKELPGDLAGKAMLIPSAAESGEALLRVLSGRGAIVVAPPAYETVRDVTRAEDLRARLEAGEIDMATFTSSSTVKNFAAAFGGAPPSLAAVALACIGPSTAQTAREIFDRAPEIIAETHTVPGLVRAVKEYYASP